MAGDPPLQDLPILFTGAGAVTARLLARLGAGE